MSDTKKIKNVIIIGGEEREYEILHHMGIKYLTRWNYQYEVCKRKFERDNGRDYNPKKDKLSIPVDFYIWVIWKCLKKRGIMFWKKPFKSIKHLKRSMWRDEFDAVVKFVVIDVLNQG